MFDVSLAELIVVGIVALIVIGPERLPSVARTFGYFLGRARRYVEQVKRDLNEEIELDNLRKLRDSMHESVDSFENSMHYEIKKIQEVVNTRPTPSSPQEPHVIEPEAKVESENVKSVATPTAKEPPRPDS